MLPSLFLTSAVFQVCNFQFHQVRRDFATLFLQENFRRIQFPGNSSTIWTISPPSRQNLVNTLNNTESHVELRFTWTLIRLGCSHLFSSIVSVKLVLPCVSLPIHMCTLVPRNPATGLASETITGSTNSNLSDATIEQFVNNLNNQNDTDPVWVNFHKPHITFNFHKPHITQRVGGIFDLFIVQK